MDLFSASKKINHKEMINFFSANKEVHNEEVINVNNIFLIR